MGAHSFEYTLGEEAYSFSVGRERTSATEEYASDFDDYDTEEEQEMLATGLQKQLSSSQESKRTVFGHGFLDGCQTSLANDLDLPTCVIRR